MKSSLNLVQILKPKLLCLVLAQVAKQPESPQIEFVHYALEIVNICILNKELRDSIMAYELPSLVRLFPEGKERNWIEYLRMLEKHD